MALHQVLETKKDVAREMLHHFFTHLALNSIFTMVFDQPFDSPLLNHAGNVSQDIASCGSNCSELQRPSVPAWIPQTNDVLL